VLGAIQVEPSEHADGERLLVKRLRDPLAGMQRSPISTGKQREAFRLANDLTMHLTSGSAIYNTTQIIFDRGSTHVPDHVRTSVTRMCVFHVILTLAKWTEFYDRYKDVIPSGVRDIAKRLSKGHSSPWYSGLRNKVVGHVWDEERHRALTNAEVEERLNAFIGSGVKEFLKWAADPDATTDIDRPLVVIEAVRDAIRSTYDLTDSDLHR
jgi:hypothetical protein